MTHRERFIGTLKHEHVDRVPDYEFGAWEQTLARWHREGMPEKFTGVWDALNDYCRTDRILDMHLVTRMLPGFERKVLEQKGDRVIIQDEEGAIVEMLNPECGASIPRYLKFPIQTRRDWERIRDERLDPDAPGRLPVNIEQLCRESWQSEDPVMINGGSLYGWMRDWMGMENLSYAVHDDPAWIEEMMEHLTRLWLSIYAKLAGNARVDLSEWWEDMCYKSGPLLSPKHVSEWMVPRYRRVTDFLKREFGCQFHMLDCDGDIEQLVPLWLKGGINLMIPLEVAHTDGYALSECFGSQIGLRGYIDKKALIQGREAIDREIARIEPLLRRGGFIPHVDHLVPPDVSFDNYLYYREKKRALLGRID